MQYTFLWEESSLKVEQGAALILISFDQHLISLNQITTRSNMEVWRTKEMITSNNICWRVTDSRIKHYKKNIENIKENVHVDIGA